MSNNQILSVAIEAADIAGHYLKRMVGQGISIDYKGRIDLLTEADVQAEKLIVKHLKAHYPAHCFLTEEQGQLEGEDKAYQWIIDPLDGTTNFAHGFPTFSVSIALKLGEEVIVGVVNDVSRSELFYAEKGSGAFMNNARIKVSTVDTLERSLLATGFGYDIQTNPDNNIAEFTAFLQCAQGVRRPGSAAIDLCNVACGRFDGFWEARLRIWDVAAGVLIAQEAGGKVTDYSGQAHRLDSPHILATNGRLHDEMIEILKTARAGR